MSEVDMFAQPATEEEKPKRRRRRRKKVEVEQEKTEQQQLERSQFAEQIGTATANLANQIVTHLPPKMFEQRALTQEEHTGIKESVSVLVGAVEEEKVQKLAQTVPLIVLGGVALIMLLSRLKRRERTDTHLWESGQRKNNSGEETRKEVVEEERRQADSDL